MEDADLQDYYDGDEAFYGQKWDIWSFFAGLIYIYIPSKFTKMAYFSQVVFFFPQSLLKLCPKPSLFRWIQRSGRGSLPGNDDSPAWH